ncbi:MAG: transcription termination factor Rho [Verrucomicrobia bacterium]|nr:transcription termination factor Rho [Verrucomicrobiota bacterium]
MTQNTHEDSQPEIPADSQGTRPPARKRAPKIIAVPSTPNKTVVAKVAAKKVVARKTAAQEVAAPEPSMPDPRDESTPKKRLSRAKKPVVDSTAGSAPVPNEPAATEPASPGKPQRFGRVPGGGPVVSREPPPHSELPQSEPAALDHQGPPAMHPPRHPQPAERQVQGQQTQNSQNRDHQGRESRSKRRRDKRKNRNDRNDRQSQGKYQPPGKYPDPPRAEGGDIPGGDPNERRPIPVPGPKIATDGMLELVPKGFGFLRLPGKNFEQLRDDIFVTPELIRRHNLRTGQWLHGLYQDGPRGPQLVELTTINDMPPEEASKLPHFDELKAINPARRISFETTPERFTTRVLDIMAPVGRGQRGLIVSPPRSGKTTLLLHMAEAIREKYEDTIHLMVLLVDERPEEVTEFRRALAGTEIFASSNDEQPRNHCRIAELAIERAKRLVESGKDVFMVMDSITRLARAYNNTMNNRGRGTGSGGITVGALEVPRRLFAAARNTRGGGSLTILATALIQTNSRADEAIFMEFKGTGNMELVLDSWSSRAPATWNSCSTARSRKTISIRPWISSNPAPAARRSSSLTTCSTRST